ncbi:MAG: hypothetical protein MAG794_00096 [Gammaproteobacteria bacterium]|nr:hypothetical protein [Gammaproteobacteria bacterium]
MFAGPKVRSHGGVAIRAQRAGPVDGIERRWQQPGALFRGGIKGTVFPKRRLAQMENTRAGRRPENRLFKTAIAAVPRGELVDARTPAPRAGREASVRGIIEVRAGYLVERHDSIVGRFAQPRR